MHAQVINTSDPYDLYIFVLNVNDEPIEWSKNTVLGDIQDIKQSVFNS